MIKKPKKEEIISSVVGLEDEEEDSEKEDNLDGEEEIGDILNEDY